MAPALACAWCGSWLERDAMHAEGGLWRCGVCGSATTFPAPSEGELDRAYDDWYRPAAGRFAGPGDALLRRSRGALARRIDEIAPPGAVLDVGCGDGALLDALADRGREASGIEREGTAHQHPRVLDGGLGEVGGSWAAVVFWHSLEHMPEAGAALGRAASLLAEHGVIVVAMPNLDSLQARAFGERWFAVDLPRHLVHVPARALRSRLDELGLRIERESHWRGGQVVFGWLHGLVGSLPGDLDLYDAIRRPAARERRLGPTARVGALAAGAVLLPLALAGTGAEAATRRGGSIYVEARRV